MSMNLTKRRSSNLLPQRPSFSEFKAEIDRLFDKFMVPNFGPDFGMESNIWSNMLLTRLMEATGEVKIDLTDKGNEFELTAEVPGVDLNDMILAATPHYVSIAGEKKAEKGEHDKKHYRMERSYGYFRRVIPLPCEIDKEHIDATYQDGVLTVTLPKSKAALVDEIKIPVKAG